MSFYSLSNRDNKNCPGLIEAQGSHHFKERVCVQVKKVYDACLQQDVLEDEKVVICPDGGPFAKPLRFIGCRNITAKGIIKDLKVDRIPDRPNFARVRANVGIKLQVEFVDADGVRGTGTAIVFIPKDVVLFVPDPSIIPFEIEATVGATCADGTFIRDFQFKLDICFTIILKVIAEVELLIPSFGFCFIPPCEEFPERICAEFFGLPLFPPQLEDLKHNFRDNM
jgi:hypothetical protein